MFDGLRDLAALWTAAGRDELWRVLLVYPGQPSTFHAEAVQLFRRHHEDGTPDALTTAQILCTDRRWERCTGRLIRGIEETGILDEAETGELAESFLWPDCLTFYRPLDWSGTAVATGMGEGAEAADDPVVRLGPGTPVRVERRILPPLRRWAAARLLRADPGALDEIRTRALEADRAEGSAIAAGMLDAVDALDDERARRAVDLGLGWPSGQVRLIALGLLADDDPVGARMRAAADPDRKVRDRFRRHEKTHQAAPGRSGPRSGRRRRRRDPDDLQARLFEWEAESGDEPPGPDKRPATDDA